MARILYAWELGGGLGHTALLANLAEHPRLRDHEAVLAVPWLFPSAEILRGRRLRVLQGPVFPPRLTGRWSRKAPFRAASFADILTLYGFADPELLGPMLAAWRNLVELVAPDLVVANHAPTLLLATRGRVPTVIVGTGFTVPPTQLDAFPPMPLSDGEAPAAPLVAADQVAAVIRAAVGGDHPAPSLPAWFRGDAAIPLVYPVLDPYQGVRAEPWVGPAQPGIGASPLPASPRVFAYLAPDYPAFTGLLEALAGLGVPVTLYARGADPAVVARLRERGVDARDQPVSFATVLPQVSLVVHNGSLGVAQAALHAGRPQASFPFDREKALTADQLRRLGVAVTGGYRQPATFPDLLRRALASREMQAAALAAAEPLGRRRWPGADAVADAVAALLAAKGSAGSR